MKGRPVGRREAGSAMVYDHGELLGWEYREHGRWDGTGTGIGTTRWMGGLGVLLFWVCCFRSGSRVFVVVLVL